MKRTITRFSLDTYRIIRTLEKQSIPRSRAFQILETMQENISNEVSKIKSVSKLELETKLDSITSQIQVDKSDLLIKLETESTNVLYSLDELARNLDVLNRQFTDNIAMLKSEIDNEHHSTKAEAREKIKSIELKISDVNHKLVLKLADMKTRMEALKMSTTRLIGWNVLMIVVSVLLIDLAFSWIERPKNLIVGNKESEN